MTLWLLLICCSSFACPSLMATMTLFSKSANFYYSYCSLLDSYCFSDYDKMTALYNWLLCSCNYTIPWCISLCSETSWLKETSFSSIIDVSLSFSARRAWMSSLSFLILSWLMAYSSFLARSISSLRILFYSL